MPGMNRVSFFILHQEWYMAIKIQVPAKKEEEVVDQEQLEDEEVVSEPEVKVDRDLELENARLKGRNEVLETLAAKPSKDPASDQSKRDEELKTSILSDSDRLTDEDFQEKYQMSKIKAVNAIHKHDTEVTRIQGAESTARLEAKEELIEKYGKDYLKHKSKIEEALADAAPEVRRDPTRLARFMETQYLALSRAEEKAPAKEPGKKDENMERRRIVNDFEKPNPSEAANRQERSKDDDLIPEEDRELASQFGITKKSELESLKSDYIDMDIGGGVTMVGMGPGQVKLVKKAS